MKLTGLSIRSEPKFEIVGLAHYGEGVNMVPVQERSTFEPNPQNLCSGGAILASEYD
jgi:hypothetical protein